MREIIFTCKVDVQSINRYGTLSLLTTNGTLTKPLKNCLSPSKQTESPSVTSLEGHNSCVPDEVAQLDAEDSDDSLKDLNWLGNLQTDTKRTTATSASSSACSQISTNPASNIPPSITAVTSPVSVNTSMSVSSPAPPNLSPFNNYVSPAATASYNIPKPGGVSVKRCKRTIKSLTSNRDVSTLKRPPFSYLQLSLMSLASAHDMMATFTDICAWIEAKFPYYQYCYQDWRKSIRQTLSQHEFFICHQSSNGQWRLDISNDDQHNILTLMSEYEQHGKSQFISEWASKLVFSVQQSKRKGTFQRNSHYYKNFSSNPIAMRAKSGSCETLSSSNVSTISGSATSHQTAGSSNTSGTNGCSGGGGFIGNSGNASQGYSQTSNGGSSHAAGQFVPPVAVHTQIKYKYFLMPVLESSPSALSIGVPLATHPQRHLERQPSTYVMEVHCPPMAPAAKPRASTARRQRATARHSAPTPNAVIPSPAPIQSSLSTTGPSSHSAVPTNHLAEVHDNHVMKNASPETYASHAANDALFDDMWTNDDGRRRNDYDLMSMSFTTENDTARDNRATPTMSDSSRQCLVSSDICRMSIDGMEDPHENLLTPPASTDARVSSFALGCVESPNAEHDPPDLLNNSMVLDTLLYTDAPFGADNITDSLS